MANLKAKDVTPAQLDACIGKVKQKQINLRVPVNLIDSLDAMALDTGQQKSTLLAKALMLYLKDHKYLGSKIKIERV